MTSLLRSSKFIRYFVSFARSIVINQPRDIDGSLIQKSQILANSSLKDYGTLVSTATETKGRNIDRLIKHLDEDVRRIGRISRRELQRVINDIRDQRYATSTQSLMVIRCCGNLVPEETQEVRTKLVKDVWNTFENIGVIMDISHYNALLRVFLENEHVFSPSEFLSDLEKKGVEPNRVTFQRLIAAYCQQGDIEGATQILEFMKEKQMPVNENVFNALIMGHSQADDMESAAGIKGVMKQANLEPSTDTYLALICGYAKRGDMDSIKKMIQESETEGINLGDRELLEIAYALGINGHLNLIDEMLEKLPKLFGFNQDAKNITLRLIARGEDKAAIKILKAMTPITSNNGESVPVGNFLIKHMVKANRPYETIISLCEELQNSKENEKALLIATEASLMNNNPDLSLKLLGALAKKDNVCQHYYWPIIVQYGNAKDKQGILNVLKQLTSDMNQSVSGETLREYVIQYMSEGEPGIHELRQGGVSLASASAASVAHLLQRGNMKAAARIGLQYRSNYNNYALRRALVSAFLKEKDIESLVTLVRIFEEGNPNSNIEEEETDNDPSGKILLSIANNLKSDRAVVLTQILQKYLEHGIGITNEIAEVLQNRLTGEELTKEISTLLTKLTSPDLISTDLQRPSPNKMLRVKDENILLNTISALESKGESSKGMKRQLLTLYCHNKELEKAEKLRKEMEVEGFEFQSGLLSLVMDLYTFHDMLPEAMETFQKINSSNENMAIDESKLVRLANLLVKNGQVDDAIGLFKNQKQVKAPERSFGYSSSCWKLLNALAEQGDADKLNELFNVMRDNNFIDPTNVLLGPLIKVHLLKNDVNSALNAFEQCCSKYSFTPWKNEIACKLIQNEDAISLQRLTDLSTQVHGEVNSLYDLVLSFVECGRIRQARKILVTPGLRLRSQRINAACEKYENEGMVNHLEGLIQATKDIPHIDRADIYQHLLSTYSKQNEVDKALSLWTQMQDEDVQPSDEFLITLASLLKTHNKPVPFVVPEIKENENKSPDTNQRSNENKKKPDAVYLQLKSLRRAIQLKDLDEALKIYENLTDADLQMSDRSSLLLFLVNNGRLGEATRLLVQWLENDLRPNIKSLNFIINNLAKVGDIDSFNAIGKLLQPEIKKLVSFVNRQTHCMVEAGRAREVLNSFESIIDSSKTPDEILKAEVDFPRGGAFSILQTNELDLVSKFEEIADKYKRKGILEPLNVLWIHNIITGNTSKAESLWPHLKSCERLMFKPLLKHSRETQNLELIEYLIKITEQSNINSRARGALYSCLLDILISKDQVEACVDKLEEGLKSCSLEDIRYGTLTKLKSLMEQNQVEFKYNIPSKRSRVNHPASSSSSDSDTEVEKSSR